MALSTLLPLLFGCGGGEPVTEVHGTITFNGKPVTAGLINFQAEGGQPLGGEIQSDGTYRYELPPGEYQVRIDTPPAASANVPQEVSAASGAAAQAPAPAATQNPVPPKYANYDTSGLTLTVTEESPQEHNFTLP